MWIKRIARGALEAVGLYAPYTLVTKGPLKEDGWFRSLRGRESVDAQGRPIPWLTYPAIEFLSRHVRPEMSVFEYGCGNSTLWWAGRVREVIACEHDPAWIEKLGPLAPANVTIRHVELQPAGDYSKTVAAYPGRFDVVVIDGRHRASCAPHAVNGLKPSGVIVWDDTYREEYRPGIDHLLGNGFRQVEFVGLIPMFNQKSETSVFYRDGNVFGL